MRETIVDRAYAKTLLPPRKEDGHKGDFGKLLVLGGSVGYTGAPYLAASAAVHSGCGLVYLGVPESIWAVEAQKCVSAMPFPLPETDGRLCLAALDRMQDKLKGCDVLALGPRPWPRKRDGAAHPHAFVAGERAAGIGRRRSERLTGLHGKAGRPPRTRDDFDAARRRICAPDGPDAPGDRVERTDRACEPLCLRSRLYLGAQGGTGRASRCRMGGCSSTQAAALRSQRAEAGTC